MSAGWDSLETKLICAIESHELPLDDVRIWHSAAQSSMRTHAMQTDPEHQDCLEMKSMTS